MRTTVLSTFFTMYSVQAATTREREASDSTVSATSEQLPQSQATEKSAETNEESLLQKASGAIDPEGQTTPVVESDVFGNEDGAEVHYKTCEW
jgi:hypothetical protein